MDTTNRSNVHPMFAATLDAFKARALPPVNTNHSTQFAVNGLCWSFQLMAERLHPETVLHAVEEAIYMAEQLPDLDLGGLRELREKLVAESRV